MNPYPQQKPQPPRAIKGSFGPYDRRELEAARAQLIHDVYTTNGGILTRVKMKCGILPNSNGNFTGCLPHPVTNVSYESQSCSLMMEDSFPWIKEQTKPQYSESDCVENGTVNGETSTCYSDERQQRTNYRYNDTKTDLIQAYDEISTSANSAKRRREQDNEEGDRGKSIKMRKFDHYEEEKGSEGMYRGSASKSSSTIQDVDEPSTSSISDTNRKNKEGNVDNSVKPVLKGILKKNTGLKWGAPAVYSQDRSRNDGTWIQEPGRPSTSANIHAIKTGEQDSMKKKADKTSLIMKSYHEEDDGIIVSDDDLDDDAGLNFVEEMVACYKCDLCDFVTTRTESIDKHLKENLHYSASRYDGIRKGSTVEPKYLSKVMEYQHKPGMYSSPIPVCPICFSIFNDIHSCYTHTQSVHGSEKPVYALGTVRGSKMGVLYAKPKCHVCHKIFPKITKLNSHMHSQKHYLYSEPQHDEFVVMMCIYCEKKSVFTNVYHYQDHLRTVHHGKSEKLATKVLYIEKPTDVKEMLPRSQRSEVQVVRDELQALCKLKRETKNNSQIWTKIQELKAKYKSMNSRSRSPNLLSSARR